MNGNREVRFPENANYGCVDCGSINHTTGDVMWCHVAQYEAAALEHLVATRSYLHDVMGRPPTNNEVAAVWATWIKRQEQP